MLHIVTCGCSFTSARRVNIHRSENQFLEDHKQFWYYPHWLQKTFPQHKVYNMGNPGNSNPIIVRSTIHKIKELISNGVDVKDIRVIVQWSSFYRRSYFISNNIKNKMPFDAHHDYVNDYISDKEYASQKGYWLNIATPDLKKSSLENTGLLSYKFNQTHLDTIYNDEARFFEWLESFDYLINFCELKNVRFKTFFMQNCFSAAYDFGLTPINYRTAEEMIKSTFSDKLIHNTWNDTKLKIDEFPYCKGLYDSIDFNKHCWFFEEEGVHKYGGVFEWSIRNQIPSTDNDFNPLFMEYQKYESQSALEEAIKDGDASFTGHVSSCNYEKFTNDVILKWDLFNE
jgi:hypothetical protein